MKGKLYKLALWYIGKCNSKWNIPNKDIQTLKRLTYRRTNDKAYLLYGLDAEWRNFGRYDVLDNAVQKLAKYEDMADNKDLRNE